ncbi:MAG: hypothetical protein QXX95_07485 [Nitrososphaerales archaeon]
MRLAIINAVLRDLATKEDVRNLKEYIDKRLEYFDKRVGDFDKRIGMLTTLMTASLIGIMAILITTIIARMV